MTCAICPNFQNWCGRLFASKDAARFSLENCIRKRAGYDPAEMPSKYENGGARTGAQV